METNQDSQWKLLTIQEAPNFKHWMMARKQLRKRQEKSTLTSKEARFRKDSNINKEGSRINLEQNLESGSRYNILFEETLDTTPNTNMHEEPHHNLLTACHGSPQRANQKILWRSLRAISLNTYLPWCALGDFNALLHEYERRGGTENNDRGACEEFQTCISDCGLMDLGYSGWPFTWRRGNLMERIDRGLGNLDWNITFSKAR
ncbi:hypothetical protein Ahy_B03g065693 [Arachis hypogaea]|uniref:Endonuclease/exonuclease/phosphatase domain-containing protein n=1 Tax=Arachis hypogaea TaxID=3818 RepID=A0A445A252_ARAHY|nr:hypothetical protein Ahy_B03g065693 [Arachis hypogaea]